MKGDRLYLLSIRECIRKIESLADAGRDKFINSWTLQDAAIRNFEIIGEATKRLSTELKAAHAGVPWKRIAGLRDVLIHDYLGVDVDEVWNIIERDLPNLKTEIEKIIGTQ